jgi:hypothetical protein
MKTREKIMFIMSDCKLQIAVQQSHHSPSLGARPSGGSGGLKDRKTGPSAPSPFRGCILRVHSVPIQFSRWIQLLIEFRPTFFFSFGTPGLRFG